MKRFTRPVNELLALHEMFRRMGYPAEELFVAFSDSGIIQFLLRHKDKPDFVIDVAGGASKHGADNRTPAVFGIEWNRALTWWNNPEVPDVLRKRIYRASEALAESAMIAAVLQAKGFVAPATLN